MATAKTKEKGAPKAPPKLEKQIGKWKGYALIVKQTKPKVDALRAEIAATMLEQGLAAVVSKYGTIRVQTTTSKFIDWEALARKFITPDILETAIPAFMKETVSEPYVKDPGWE